MTGNRRTLSTLLTLALAIPAAVAATPPELISYQGVLRSADGAPLDGPYDLIFRFVDAPIGGTLLLTDYHTGPNAVLVDGGLFTALLGGGTLSPGIESSLLDVFGNYAPVYLEVQVGAETLTPRVQIVSTGYALNAGRFGGELPEGYLDIGPTDQVKQGSLTSYTGIAAQSDATSGDVRALEGTTVSSAGVAVLGSALATSGAAEGVRGQSTSPGGRGVVGGAFATSGASTGVLGESQSPDGTGVHGRATATNGGTVGVAGEVFSTLGTGVAGVARATSGEAWGVYGETASPDGYGVVSIGDSITAGDVYATGTKYFFTEHPHEADRALRFACLEGGEVAVFQRGSGRLEGGAARVELPDPFPLVAAGQITVQVTAHEACGGLYVPPHEISAEGFTVRESGETRSNAAFSYLVLAERVGYEEAEAVGSLSVADKILTSSHLSSDQKASLRATLLSQPEQQLAAEDRTALYSTLHEGDFDGSCRVLGGCDHPAKELVDDVQLDRPQDRRIVTRPESSTLPPDRTNSIDQASEVARYPIAPPKPPLSPSVLVTQLEVVRAVEAGDVVVLDRGSGGALRPGSEVSDPSVIGVVAFVEGQVPAGELAPVAVAGIVPCHVDAQYGWISPGDLLVVSPTPGYAMRAEDPTPGTILGKALESLEVGQGKIQVLLTPR